jgi:hypothetical protein
MQFDETAFTRYRKNITTAVNRVYHGEWGLPTRQVRPGVHVCVFTKSELRAFALEVTFERSHLWDAKVYPPTWDLVQHVLNLARKDLRAHGWRKRRGVWVQVGGEPSYFITRGLDGDSTWAPESVLFGDEGEAYSLRPDWPAWTPGEWHLFARYFRASYPRAAAAFIALDAEERPRGTRKDKWKARQAEARQVLWVRYALELAESCFYITNGYHAIEAAA